MRTRSQFLARHRVIFKYTVLASILYQPRYQYLPWLLAGCVRAPSLVLCHPFPRASCRDMDVRFVCSTILSSPIQAVHQCSPQQCGGRTLHAC